MKGTEHFKDVIQNYLETRASYDELFAENFHKENKNIDECITYILTEVQRMGCAGLSDEEVYSTILSNSRRRKKQKHGKRLSSDTMQKNTANLPLRNPKWRSRWNSR